MVIVSTQDVGDDDGIIINSMDVIDSLIVGGSIATLVVSIDSSMEAVVDVFAVGGMAIVSARDVGDDDGIIINSMDVADSLIVGGSIATLVVSIDSMDAVVDLFAVGGMVIISARDVGDDDGIINSMDVVDSLIVGGSIATLVVSIDSMDAVVDLFAVGDMVSITPRLVVLALHDVGSD